MVASSDELEAYHQQLRKLDSKLEKYGSRELTDSRLLSDLRSSAKEWLRYSEGLRRSEQFSAQTLDKYDSSMKEALESANTRSRASAYRKRLGPVVSGFVADVIVPLIKYEGSPAQVAARQLQTAFSGHLTVAEAAYVDEASRCLSLRCHRAAVVMLWAAAMSRFHNAIEGMGYTTYNEAVNTVTAKNVRPFKDVRKGPVASLPELQRVRDFDIIVIGMELWKYDIQAFAELERLLGIRNNSAHPGMLQPTALDVQQFASNLSTYVFSVISA